MSATEFECVACKRYIYSVGGPPGIKLCASCAHIPGWYRDPVLRESLDSDFNDPLPPVSPEQFLDFPIHQYFGPPVLVRELMSLEKLQDAYAEEGEHGMWQLVRIEIIKRQRDAKTP